MLGAIVAFIIDKKFVPAAIYCLIGAALGFIGLIHAEQVGWNVGGQIALGYLFAGIVLLLFALTTRGKPAADATPTDDATPADHAPADARPVTVPEPIDTTRPATA